MSEFAAVIELSELDGSNGFRINGEAADDKSGFPVASAGDVNGDGFDDLIVGARHADPNGSSSGASYVVFGKASGFGAALQLSALDGSNGFQINGEAAYDESGFPVASAGDVNGDGFDDLIVGARWADPNGSNSGASYVVFGKASGFGADLQLSALNGSNGFQINGEVYGYTTGGSAASAGDFNGDGFDDLIVGAYGADLNGNNSGASYVVFGQASGFGAELELSDLDGSNGFRINGEASNDKSGRPVASAGDFNGDGFDDLIVGAYGADPNGSNSGASYVVFGKALEFGSVLELSTLDGSNGFQINGEAASDNSGYSVASAGDVNGDGFDDLIVGARYADPNGSNSGASYVVFGKASGFGAILELSDLDGSNGFQINGEAAGDVSGWSVASAGDVNADGFDDLIVGALGADPNGSTSGASYVVFGIATGFSAALELSDLDGSNGFQINGEIAGDLSGVSVASAGDVNGDGFDDLIVGAGYADPNGLGTAGASYVIYGRAPDAAVNRIGSAADQTIRGGAFADTLSGLGGDDGLFGGDGADVLDGGVGADTMTGGEDGDLYYVDDAGDVIIEDGIEGYDTVYVGLNYTLQAGVSLEGLRSVSESGLALGGNELANGIYGGDGGDTISGLDGDDSLFGGLGADSLDGGTGADSMDGGEGDDVYVVDNAGDVITELADEGEDTVRSHIDYTLQAGASLEALTALSDAGLTLAGNGLANAVNGADGADILFGLDGDDFLLGGLGADSLDGGTGADSMEGGEGDDVYVVDNAGDVITELADEGEDTVRSHIDYTLQAGASLEALTALSDAGLTLAGNGLANAVNGADGADILFGLGGDDRLFGGYGWDTLAGGAGDDVLVGAHGYDLASFEKAANAVTVDLSLKIAQDTGEGMDRLVSIEALTGSSFGDVLIGNLGKNALYGGDGDDTLAGLGGDDRLFGGYGWDTLAGGAGDDVLVGAQGYDLASYDMAANAVTVDLSLIIAQDTGEGMDRLVSIEALTGSTFDDVLTGNLGKNALYGGAGDDTLTGGTGGDDLFGGEGADTFIFLESSLTNRSKVDKIRDLSAEDTIDLSAIDADPGSPDDDAFVLVTRFSGSGGEARIVYNALNDVSYLLLDVDGDRAADFLLRMDGDHREFEGFVW